MNEICPGMDEICRSNLGALHQTVTMILMQLPFSRPVTFADLASASQIKGLLYASQVAFPGFAVALVAIPGFEVPPVAIPGFEVPPVAIPGFAVRQV